MNRSLFKIIIVGFLLYNINYTQQELERRYDLEGMYFKDYNQDHLKPHLVRKFLASHGIKYPDSVVSAPDQSPNLTLYIMNLNGWSEFSSPPIPIPFERVYDLAQCCTKYLIIHDKEYLKREDLKPAFKNLKASYKNSIFIFDIQHLKEK